MKEKYFEYLEKQYDEFIEREEDIEMLKSISKSYGNLSDFLAEASLQEHSKGENTSINMPVILSTIHQAKGLEWKVVFIIGVSQNHFPYSYKYATEDFEEERRVFYVATTRAKESLYISFCLKNYHDNSFNGKSVFIEEIPKEAYQELSFSPHYPKPTNFLYKKTYW